MLSENEISRAIGLLNDKTGGPEKAVSDLMGWLKASGVTKDQFNKMVSSAEKQIPGATKDGRVAKVLDHISSKL